MQRPTLSGLPQEILLQILGIVDGKTLITSCPLVCRSWKAAIEGCAELQLSVELWADGMVAGATPGLTPTETLEALYERRRAWLGLNWSSRTVLRLEPGFRAYDLVGGVFGQLWDTSFAASWLPSARDPTTRTSTTVLGFRPKDFVMDPSQDLVAFVYESAVNDVSVDCRSLSSLKPHPLAAHRVLTFSVGTFLLSFLTVDLADDIISLFFDHSGRIVLLNWRKGMVLAGLGGTFPPFTPFSFSLLTPRAYILGYRGAQPKLEIWVFEGGAHTHTTTLLLPEVEIQSGEVSFSTHSGAFCANPLAGRRFSKSNDERIFVVSFGDSYLFVHYRYLLKRIQNRGEAIVVPWNEWGPKHTRMRFETPRQWLRYVHGERVVLSQNPQNPTALQVLDFGMSASRRAFPGEVPSDTQFVTELHTDPSTIVDRNLVAKSVTTSLPYRQIVGWVDREYDVFLIDEDQTVGVDEAVRIFVTDLLALWLMGPCSETNLQYSCFECLKAVLRQIYPRFLVDCAFEWIKLS
ncbi:hypothetical protein GGX14DRAFT_369194 [Mycena pura]|uniref:F-box domain-containing protein n=1 Tax=Mycena pura TaxID=153505 RepID=A0AAD6Y7L5_9AGAR|nr:hypothetical protein GGX14DRAFT_369194 [Mycena pura]